MRIALVAVVFSCLATGRGAIAEDLSGKLAELESGTAAPSGKVQIVPGLEIPQQTPAVPLEAEDEAAPDTEPEPTGASEDSGEISGESVNGGSGLTVEPRVEDTPQP